MRYPAHGQQRAWVTTIAMNLAREHWRRTKRRKTSLDDTLDRRAAPVAEQGPIETRQRADALRGGLAQLPESHRAVVELHWLQELPFAEVAQIVGTSEGAARVRAHRACKKLKELLEPERYRVTYPELRRTLTIYFSIAFPHSILGWEEDAREGRTEAVRTHAVMTHYRAHHVAGDGACRRALGLTE